MSTSDAGLVFDHPSWTADPGLGKIAYAANGNSKHFRDKRKMWQKYDERFGDRYDYRLWRRVARSRYPSSVSDGWGKVSAIALQGLNRKDSKEVWGLLAVLAASIARQANRTKWNENGGQFPDFTVDDIGTIAVRAQYRLASLSPLAGWEAECAIIGCLVLDAAQNLRQKSAQRP